MEILKPIEIAVAWIMVQFHSLLTAAGMEPASGWTWALSIVGLTVVIRIILIPLFVKQINASRGMQLIQPELRKIQEKYKGKKDDASRQAMTKETMDLYKKTGTNPFSSCLPILLQMPIFFALFRVLNEYVPKERAIGPLTAELASQADRSQILGAQLSSTFLNSGDDYAVKLLTVVLIVLMSASQFITQKQLMSKNMPASAMEGNPFMQQQKMLLYILPLVFAVSGVNFPIGVLLYWLTTNLWSMGQQFFVIYRRPAPGSPAEAARNERLARKGKPIPGAPTVVETAVELEKKGQRVQPKRKDRQRKPGQAGSQPQGQPRGQVSDQVSDQASRQANGQANGQASGQATRAAGTGKGPDAAAGT